MCKGGLMFEVEREEFELLLERIDKLGRFL